MASFCSPSGRTLARDARPGRKGVVVASADASPAAQDHSHRDPHSPLNSAETPVRRARDAAQSLDRARRRRPPLGEAGGEFRPACHILWLAGRSPDLVEPPLFDPRPLMEYPREGQNSLRVVRSWNPSWRTQHPFRSLCRSYFPNTYEFESSPMVKPTGFREYDARWLFEKEINLMGVEALGMGLGTLIHEMGVRPEIVTGHDFRAYSSSIKYALGLRLDVGGAEGEGHRPRLVPHGVFRAVRARLPLRRHGDGFSQRQWLDGREDGRQPAPHLRAGRDGPPQGHRARREIRSAGRWWL